VSLADVAHALQSVWRLHPWTRSRAVLLASLGLAPRGAMGAKLPALIEAAEGAGGGAVLTGSAVAGAADPWTEAAVSPAGAVTACRWGPDEAWAPLRPCPAAEEEGGAELLWCPPVHVLGAAAQAAVVAATSPDVTADGWREAGARAHATGDRPSAAWVSVASEAGLAVTPVPVGEGVAPASLALSGAMHPSVPLRASDAPGADPPRAAAPPPGTDPADVVVAEAFARVGVMGNPSDGFFGRTVSATVSNFRATVTLWPDDSPAGRRGRVTLAPHPIYDPTAFDNCLQAEAVARREGYSGGSRLLLACLHRLHRRLREAGVLPEGADRRGFVAKWHTTVPRQVGLAGSSAILTAFTRALLRFWGLHRRPEALEAAGLGMQGAPSFVLAVETEELGINAGLQDRVAQWWEGAVAMDFARELVEATGAGRYERLRVARLPALFLAFAPDPSDSGRIHAPVRERWLAGDGEVVGGMAAVAACAAEAAALLRGGEGEGDDTGPSAAGRASSLASLMSKNFDLRRSLFGDGALGAANLRMVEIARAAGAAAKFPGSGGAVVGVVDVLGMVVAGALHAGAVPAEGSGPEAYEEAADAGVEALRRAYAAEGFVCVRLEPTEGHGGGIGAE